LIKPYGYDAKDTVVFVLRAAFQNFEHFLREESDGVGPTDLQRGGQGLPIEVLELELGDAATQAVALKVVPHDILDALGVHAGSPRELELVRVGRRRVGDVAGLSVGRHVGDGLELTDRGLVVARHFRDDLGLTVDNGRVRGFNGVELPAMLRGWMIGVQEWIECGWAGVRGFSGVKMPAML
jgi:hypothetical protein